jgi:hypothetical protein
MRFGVITNGESSEQQAKIAAVGMKGVWLNRAAASGDAVPARLGPQTISPWERQR